MKYVIEKGKQPAYIQLYEMLRDDIVDGNYTYGSKLPSKRLLSSETGVSTVTVEHAYTLLCEEGYIQSRERSGFFVIFRASDGFALPSHLQPPSSSYHEIHQTFSEVSFSLLGKTMRSVLTKYGEEILNKSPNCGCTQFRETICRYLARNRGINVSPKQIIIGSGAEYLYGLIIELLGRDRIFAFETPSYQKIEQVYRLAGVKYELLPICHDGIDSLALSSTSASVLHTTPYRSFPSGVTASASKRHEYIRWADKENRFIIEDDFESEFSVSTKPEETLFALSKNDNVIYLNTFSKTVSPSLRVGYMVLPEKLVQTFTETLGIYSCTVPTFEQFVLTELINSGDFERHINRVRRRKRKEILGK